MTSNGLFFYIRGNNLKWRSFAHIAIDHQPLTALE